MMQVCKFSHLEFGDPVPYHDLGRDKAGSGGYQTYIDESMATLLKVSISKISRPFMEGTEVEGDLRIL